MVHLEFKATNNMAEYEALIFSLSVALSLGIREREMCPWAISIRFW
jgi:ribonuclease HI